MKNLIQTSFIVIVFFLFSCSSNTKSKVTCSENEAYNFAKQRLESSLSMQISAYDCLSKSNETCQYKFLFEGISYSYNCGVDVTITVKKTENGWDAIAVDVDIL